MRATNFSIANKRIINHVPFFNKVLKTLNKSDKGEIIYTSVLEKNKSVLFVCDYEGKILSVDPPFSDINCNFNNAAEKSILNYIHQEDVYFVIEHLVKLLQEKSESLVFEARFLCYENHFLYIKWHVVYFCEMFFFYPINLPKNKMVLNQINKPETVQKPLEKIGLNNFFWKMEVIKTMYEWDQIIDKQLKNCFNI